MVHQDLPKALLLLNEMNVCAQNVANLVDNMLQKVHNGEITTSQGLSFLEVKYQMLLSYLINLTYVVLRKTAGEVIENHPVVDRLIEIRTVLEKMKPIDHKLKYQIDKLVKTAVSGVRPDDPATFKANPENLIGKDSEGSDSEASDASENESKSKQGIYVPPKLSAVHYTGGESAQEKNKRIQEKSKKHGLSMSIMQDLKEEYLDAPIEVSQGSRAQQILSKEQREIQEYEEEYMTRLPITKADKHRRKQMTTLGTLGDEITNFKSISGGKRKRKPNNKMKGRKIRRK